MAEYIVHKAVELSKVKAKRRAELEKPGVLESQYIAQPKYDGCNLVVEIHEDMSGDFWSYAYSRTGEEVKSIGHIQLALEQFPGIKAGAYLGECWCPDLPFNEISGLFRRQAADEDTCRLQFAIFDYLTWDEWNTGKSDMAYANRVARMSSDFGSIAQGQAPFWLAGSFGYIWETWPNTSAQVVCNKLVDVGGYDGLILRDPYGTWTKGDRGTGGEIIKIKRKLSFDLRVLGMEAGKGKHAGRLGALILDFNGKHLRVGTGFTDAEREAWWGYIGSKTIVGKIVEVEAMDYSSDGLLREPRFKGIRYDKAEPDA